MRSEDLSGIPESIEAWRVGELLEGLGFKPGSYKDVAEILIEPRGVVVRVYATNAEGRRYQVEGEMVEVTGLGEKDPSYVHGPTQAAMHMISIPFVGGWEKPAQYNGGVVVPCPGQSESLDGSSAKCELAYGHTGDCQGEDSNGNNRLWRSTPAN